MPGRTRGALDRCWRLVIASALNAEIDEIALPYAAKVIRELFMNSAFAGSMGMSTVPLSKLYARVTPFLEEQSGNVLLNSHAEGADWDEETLQWTLQTRTGELLSDFI